MFTGLIQEVGEVTRAERSAAGMVWTIRAAGIAREVKAGDSVNIAGACQTVETVSGDSFTGTSIPETLAKTTYGNWARGQQVNLELSLRASDRLGGHLVSGHVDAVGHVTAIDQVGGAHNLTILFDPQYAPWTIAQGSIAIDGVSLTIARRGEQSVTVALIPETLNRTTLASLRVGDPVNLEFDQLIKAVVQTVRSLKASSANVTEEMLATAGWS